MRRPFVGAGPVHVGLIDVALNAELAGVDQQQAEALVAKAHTICPYSKATRGNIEVKLLANGKPVEGGAK